MLKSSFRVHNFPQQLKPASILLRSRPGLRPCRFKPRAIRMFSSLFRPDTRIAFAPASRIKGLRIRISAANLPFALP